MGPEVEGAHVGSARCCACGLVHIVTLGGGGGDEEGDSYSRDE